MHVWTIVWKDMLVRLRDWKGLLLILAAPLALAAVLGAALGGQGSAETLAPLPVLLVDADRSAASQALALELARPQQAAPTLLLTPIDQLTAAQQALAKGQARALLYIPAGFGQAIQAAPGLSVPASQIEIMTDPANPTTAAVAEALIVRVLSRLSAQEHSRQTVLALLGQATGDQPAIQADIQTALLAPPSQPLAPIALRSAASPDAAISPLAYAMPGMLIFFLMFAMFEQTNAIVLEQQQGTLRRLLSTPASSGQVLLGKFGGAFLIGLAQAITLIVASRLIFGLHWGPSLPALGLVVLSAVGAVTSLGALVAALANTSQQANLLAGLITLLSAALGGSFVPLGRLPEWLQPLSYLTINRWTLQGFASLMLQQQGLVAVLPATLVLLGIAVGCLTLATFRLQRRMAR